MPKTITPARLEELEKAEQKAKDLEQKLEGALTPDQVEKIKEENKRLKTEAEAGERQSLRVKLEKFVSEEVERQNKAHFNNKITGSFLAEAAEVVKKNINDEQLTKALRDKVDGESYLQDSLKEQVNNQLKSRLSMLEEWEAKHLSARIAAENRGININTMSEVGRTVGSMNERTYLSDTNAANFDIRNRMNDWMLERVFNKPMVNPATGRTWLQDHPRAAWLHELAALQEGYNAGIGAGDGNLLSRGGRLFESFQSPGAQKVFKGFIEAEGKARRVMLEANEIDTADIISVASLPNDFSKAIIMATFARNLFAEVAASRGVMNSRSATVYDFQYPNSDIDLFQKEKHFFGAVDSDTPSTLDLAKTLADGTDATDDTPLLRASGHIPQDVWAYVGEVVDADTTITITGTNHNGLTTATASVTIYTTDIVGTTRKFIPTVLGDRFMDVTAVASTGWTDAAAKGEVGIFVGKPVSGAGAGSAAQKVGEQMVAHTVTENPYAVQSNLSLSAIEDMARALAAGGNGGIDLIAKTIRTMSGFLNDYIDRIGFDKMVQGVYANNVLSFNSTVPGEGHSDETWKALFRYNLDVLSAMVETNSNFAPTLQVWHLNDKPEYKQWLAQHLDAFAPQLNDPFADNKAKFELNGQSIYVSKNSLLERVLMANNVAETGAHYWIYVPFTLYQAPDPTGGFDQVVMLRHRAAIEVINGRSLGLLQVTRR